MLYDLIYRWNLKVKLTETENRMVVARNEGWGFRGSGELLGLQMGRWCRGVGPGAKGSPWCLAGGTRADGAPPHPPLPQPHGTFPGALLCRLPQRGLRQVSQGRVWGVVSDIPGRDTSLLTPVFPFGQ